MAFTARVRTTAPSGGRAAPRTVHGRAGVRVGLALGAALAASATAVALSVPATVAQAAPASTTTLLSLQGGTLSPAAASAWVQARGGRVLATYAVADALLVSLPQGTVPPAGAVAVSDVPLHVTAASTAAADVKGATYRATLGAPSGATGEGVTVAVVDTGVQDVADLAGRVTHVNVSGGDAGDGLGHGTFMAGLVAGDGSSSDGTYIGVAPDARILDVQVATTDGSTSLSRVLAGLQAVADAAADDPSVKVVSLALSTGSPLPPSGDPLARALDRLWALGLTVVVAAGNDGPDAGTVTSPGADPTLITVGALDEHGTAARGDDTVADFSSRGTAFGNSKPDVVAPGVSLVATRAPGSSADVENPASRVGDSYFTGSGSSMAEAVVAGAAAVLLDVRPALTPDSVKKLLTGTAYRSSDLQKADGAGKGAVDLAAAVKAAPKAALLKPSGKVAALATDSYGPTPADAATWEQFQQAWEAEDLEAAAAAWALLSEQTRRWAATAFALALVSANAGTDDEEFAAIEKLAHRWAVEAWSSRGWADDRFVAHRWADADWAAHRWAAHRWAADAWTEQSWSAHRWAAHRWADYAWTAHRWAAHRWAAEGWDAHRWAVQAWSV
jgi:serine protease AprX